MAGIRLILKGKEKCRDIYSTYLSVLGYVRQFIRVNLDYIYSTFVSFHHLLNYGHSQAARPTPGLQKKKLASSETP